MLLVVDQKYRQGVLWVGQQFRRPGQVLDHPSAPGSGRALLRIVLLGSCCTKAGENAAATAIKRFLAPFLTASLSPAARSSGRERCGQSVSGCSTPSASSDGD